MNNVKLLKFAGFTLIELLVVISIIGLLASIVLVNLNQAREKAKVAQIVAQLHELKKAVAFYYDDTGQYPATCRLSCTAATDPFANSLGVPGWAGPYFTLWNFTHPWGGHVGFANGPDWDGDGNPDYGFVLDDDLPGTNGNNNKGAIPRQSLLRIDQQLDDGNLGSGEVQGDTQGFPNFTGAVGELVIRIRF